MSTQIVSVSLPSPIIYVTGAVNGAAVTFTLTGDCLWSGTCAVAENGIYEVEITGCDSAGNTTDYSITLFYGLHLVLDRTAADVRDKTPKGYYNASDLNRVGAAMAFVSAELKHYGYGLGISPKQDWSETDIPTTSDMTKYLSDLASLKDCFTVWQSTPPAPESMSGLTYTAANNIEQILHDIDELLHLMLLSFVYSGEVFAGEV